MNQNNTACDSEKIFENIFENIIDGIVLADVETKEIAKCNRAICQMLGYTKEELVGISIFKMHPENSRAHVEKLFNQLLSKEIEIAKNVSLIAKEGHLLTVDIASSRICYNGRAHLLGIFRDVTEREKIQNNLRQSEERFRALFEQARVAIAISRSEKIIFANKRFLQMLGYNDDSEILGKNFFDFVAPSSKAQISKIHESSRYDEKYLEPLEVEITLLRRDGTEFHVSIAVSNVALPDGLASMGFITDISGRKKVEEELKKNEAVLKSLFNAAPIGIGLLVDRIYVKVNNMLCKILGYSEKEVIGQHVRFSYDDEDEYNRVGLELNGQMEREGLGITESVFKRKEGALINVLLCLSPLDVNDISAGVTVTVLDITERKKTEAEHSRLKEILLHSQKIESIGRLAGGIAHDFNNLLTAISGNTELAIYELDSGGKPHSPLMEITKAVQSAGNLTKQLLAFSRKQVTEPQVIDLNELIEHVHKMIATLIGENIQLELSLSRDLYPMKADQGQIEQIIVNLAANSRDAMPDGGKLIIKTSNIHLDGKFSGIHGHIPSGDYVMIRISDTGMGMSKEAQDHLFEPFFTTKEKGYGTGLGLATVYGIVKQNNAAIEVSSEIKKGTTIKIYFPKTLESGIDALKLKKKSVIPHGTETILVAEDQPQVLEFVQKILTKLGYNVLTALSGEEALSIAENYREKIHLFMTDVMLPGINGRIAAERLLTARPEVKILFNSGYTAEIIDKQGILEKGINFINKPFTAQEISNKVREILDKK